jgi:hypothetical protein
MLRISTGEAITHWKRGRTRFRVFPRNQWNADAPGRESVPRATGPARGTESQRFSFGERFAVEKLNAHWLKWFAGRSPYRCRELRLGILDLFSSLSLFHWKRGCRDFTTMTSWNDRFSRMVGG